MLAAALAAQGAETLVRYSFDDQQIEAGPDTFSVFQRGQGAVLLSTANRFSGYRAVELRDVPGDGTFPELQGYFPRRARGKVYLHFALMTTDPAEELNIALAGPQWFKLRKDGIGFWLKTAGGYLTAISDSMPKKLFAPRAFVWYVVDAVYDVDAGTYDLTIRQEGVEQPVAMQQGAANAPNQPGSQVDKFSFIGDHLTDESKAVYYVDDVVVSADGPGVASPPPFAAPARRKLFVDYWSDQQRTRARRPGPLPLMRLEDVGVGPDELHQLREDQAADLLQPIVAGRFTSLPGGLSGRSRALLAAIIAWRRGDAALGGEGKPELALKLYDQALQHLPAAPLVRINAAMALAQLGRWEDADARLAEVAREWRTDPRLPVALALAGLARGDLAGVERQLREGAEASGVLAQQYFLTLLWLGENARAEAFAASMQARAASRAEGAVWQERLGDAAFLSGDAARARPFYEAAAAGSTWPGAVWSKLSDVHFKLGDLEREREYRERVFGSLRGGSSR